MSAWATVSGQTGISWHNPLLLHVPPIKPENHHGGGETQATNCIHTFQCHLSNKEPHNLKETFLISVGTSSILFVFYKHIFRLLMVSRVLLWMWLIGLCDILVSLYLILGYFSQFYGPPRDNCKSDIASKSNSTDFLNQLHIFWGVIHIVAAPFKKERFDVSYYKGRTAWKNLTWAIFNNQTVIEKHHRNHIHF